MHQTCWKRHAALQCLFFAAFLFYLVPSTAQEPDSIPVAQEQKTVEPVFRVSKLATGTNDTEKSAIEASIAAEPMPTVGGPSNENAPRSHPLDEAIQIAHDGLTNMRENILDYTSVFVKRERIGNELGERQYISLKIRNERNTAQGRQPFSVYMKFLKPRDVAGREVIWVTGRNGNKLLAHESGLLGVKTFRLDPTGWLAMKGQRYPIYDAGLENMILKLIEKAERDRAAGDCIVEKRCNATINDRSCTLLEVIHPQRAAPFEFYKAQVFIDNELKVPIRYAAYDWPKPGQQPELLEEYTYINLKLNVGLTDMDFDTANPQYRYPR